MWAKPTSGKLFKVDDAVDQTTFFYYCYSQMYDWGCELSPFPKIQAQRFVVRKIDEKYFLRRQRVQSDGTLSDWNDMPCRLSSNGIEQEIVGGKCFDGSHSGYKVLADGVLIFWSTSMDSFIVPWAY